MMFLQSVWAWMLANPLLVWPIVTAVASLIYTKLDAYPRVHAVFSVLASLGIDLPKLMAMLQKLFTGKDPNSGSGSSQAKTLPSVPKPPSREVTGPSVQRLGFGRYAMTWCAGIYLSAILCGCGVGQIFGPGSNVPGDLEADASCVAGQLIQGNTNPGSVAAICSMAIDQTFQDLWAFLVHALGAKGKLTPAQVSAASEAMAKQVAK